MKLTKLKVTEIKTLLALDGLPQNEVARLSGVGTSQIGRIANNQAHVDVPWPKGTVGPKKAVPVAVEDKEGYDPTNERILELESEVVLLQEENQREKRRVKASAKVGGLFKAIVKEMDERIQPLPEAPCLWVPSEQGQITEHCVLHISDCHADQVVRPDSVGGLEEFNFPIACARGEHLVDTTIKWTQETLAPGFCFPVLWVLVYGDLSCGTIHGAAERSYYRNQTRNCLATGQLLALMIRDLSSHFEHVNVVCVSGNHGRQSLKKDYNAALENFDYLIAEIARLHCRNLINTSFLIPDAWSINLVINGVGVNLSHGDDVRSNGGLPWYGFVRRQKSLIALGSVKGGVRTRYFVMGHHHVSAALADVDGELLINGAWVATDPFAFNSLSGYREPCQLLHGMNEKYGATWRLPIKLKTDNERKGPKRYLIDGSRDVGPLLCD